MVIMYVQNKTGLPTVPKFNNLYPIWLCETSRRKINYLHWNISIFRSNRPFLEHIYL